MTRGLTIFSLVLLSIACTSQSKNKGSQISACEKCRSDVVSHTSRNENNLTEGDVASFLCSLGEECLNNAEFTQTSNELLFYVFTHYPGLSLKSLAKNKDIQRGFVVDQLSKPIHDMIDLEETVRAIESIEGYDEVKREVLNSLQRAIAGLSK